MVALLWDAYLVRTGRASLTEHVQRHPVVALCCAGYLTAHFVGKPSRARSIDPLRLAARRLRN